MSTTPFPNQPAPYAERNLFAEDAALDDAVRTQGAAASMGALRAFGAKLGTAEVLGLGELANRHPPELATHDARGERVDEVTFHPAWDALMQIAREAGEHCLPWTTPTAGAQVARAAQIFLHAQVENGTQCPITMTFAAIPVLRRHQAEIPHFASVWEPRLVALTHDARSAPVAAKAAALIGMGMTERQGGSDVRSNRTRAEPTSDGSFRITGHKWFFSVPQSDAHLVLAQEATGLSCFFLPRFAPDGTRNAIRLQRLKDKLGNRSNASSEVEFEDAIAWRIGQPGQGIATILEMVRYTRLDCVLGSAGIMRAALARALHHAQQRVAFGKRLIEQPLMENVLADIALEVEAATFLALRLARAFEAPAASAEDAFARLVTPAAKYWVCKRGPALAAEAMEVLGGNGYIEASGLPRLYRELPVNSIWEGSGNVMCLDVLRMVQREPVAVDALRAELERARGRHAAFDAGLQDLHGALARPIDPQDARRVTQRIAVLLQAALLLQHAPAFVADAFCASRLAPDIYAGAAFGSLRDHAALEPILARAAGSWR
ncbi:MAG TPA: isovaleryl-CoA dehydrogenase [Casimicrobiaceae bacterium]|nr:isovaleryl-CoA dehydrogenase [Casimicrobiaceae bacterium]